MYVFLAHQEFSITARNSPWPHRPNDPEREKKKRSGEKQQQHYLLPLEKKQNLPIKEKEKEREREEINKYFFGIEMASFFSEQKYSFEL